MTINPQILLDFALETIWDAGRLTLGYFQTGLAIERKADNTPVTAADQGAEKLIRERILKHWPDDGIIGEEYGNQASKTGRTWIIDPIDGTKSFIHGVPLYANLIAVADAAGTIAGVAHFPALNETVYAGRGLGCHWNGRRCAVSSVNTLADAAIMTSQPESYDANGHSGKAWQQLVDASYIQRTWGDAYGYALVATGRAEAMVDVGLAIWDGAPFMVIMEEAGGMFTSWQGERTIDPKTSVASNGHLHESILQITRQP